jgi:hypothetical protein
MASYARKATRKRSVASRKIVSPTTATAVVHPLEVVGIGEHDGDGRRRALGYSLDARPAIAVHLMPNYLVLWVVPANGLTTAVRRRCYSIHLGQNVIDVIDFTFSQS